MTRHTDNSFHAGETDSPRTRAARVRVAFFSDSLPERNGAGAYYHDLTGHLAPEVDGLEVIQPRVEDRYLRISLPLPGDSTQRFITPNLPGIANTCKRLRPNVVVAVTPGPFGFLALYYARRWGATCLTAFHTNFEQLARIYWNRFFGAFINAGLRGANRVLFRRSAAVLINNSHLRTEVEALGARAVEVMGTPLQIGFLATPPKPPPEPLRQVCFAGRLAPEKNLPLVIEAARALPDVRFVICGDGPLRRTLETDAAALPNIRFTGWLSRPDLIELLDASALLLLPSRFETFGSVALEAMARGRPALVSANAGIHDWPGLRDGLLTLRPEASLADTLADLLRRPSDFWQQKTAAARNAAERFNNATVGQWTETLAKYAKL